MIARLSCYSDISTPITRVTSNRTAKPQTMGRQLYSWPLYFSPDSSTVAGGMSVMPQGKHTHNSFMHYTNFKFKPKLNLTNPFPFLKLHITVVLQLATIKLFMFWSSRPPPFSSLRPAVSQSTWIERTMPVFTEIELWCNYCCLRHVQIQNNTMLFTLEC